MGSSASKASRTAGAAARKYPSRTTPPPPPPPQSRATNATPQPPPAAERQPGPTVHPQAQASGSRNEAINLDASDPDFARSLRSLGPVQPNPTLSGSSTFPQPSDYSRESQNTYSRPSALDPRKNPAITVLESRTRLQSEADAEFQVAGRRGHAGRQFLDVYMIRQILIMRDEKGKSAAEIEKSMGLKPGVVARLGSNGVLGLAHEMGRANKEVHIV